MSYFDSILIDINLSCENGLDFFRWLEKIKVQTHVIFLSAFFHQEKIEEKCLNLNVYDFLKKPISWQALKIRFLRFANMLKSTKICKYFNDLKIIFDYLDHNLLINGKRLNLTKREYKVFKYLLNNLDMTVSRDELISLFNQKYIKTSRSIDVLVSNLRNKVTSFSQNFLISSVYGQGYKLHTANKG